MRKILWEISKDLKLIFRNKTSLFLLVLGPLILILLVGFAFSGKEVHSIRLGLVAEDTGAFSGLIQNFSGVGEVIHYEDIGSCLSEMESGYIHLCFQASQEIISTGSDIPTLQAEFYFDNTRKKISSAIIDELSDYLGVQADEISISSARTILGNIQTLVVFLQERDSDLDSLTAEAENIRSDLVERKQALMEFNESFYPKYIRLKKLNARLDYYGDRFNESYMDFESELIGLSSSIYGFEEASRSAFDYGQELYVVNASGMLFLATNISVLPNATAEKVNASLINVTNKTFYYQGSFVNSSWLSAKDASSVAGRAALGAAESLQSQIERIQDVSEDYYEDAFAMKREFDEAVALLDAMNQMIETEIVTTDENIAKIDAAVIRIADIRYAMAKNLDNLALLDPDLAESLVRPIVQSYQPLDSSIKDIEIVFPALLTLVIIFISILFSTMMTLKEINSSAHFRNEISPQKQVLFTLGLYLSSMMVVAVQVSVLLLVGRYQFHIDVGPVIAEIAFISLILASIFCLIGMIYAYLLRNEGTSVLASIFTALGFYMFSDAITPLETMPIDAAKAAALNPYVLATSIFKKLISFQIPLSGMRDEVLLLCGFVAICVLILSRVHKR